MDLNAFEVYNGTEKHIEMQVLLVNTCSMVELMDIQRYNQHQILNQRCDQKRNNIALNVYLSHLWSACGLF